MAITPTAGFKIDPNNPNAVVPIAGNNPSNQPVAAPTPTSYTTPSGLTIPVSSVQNPQTPITVQNAPTVPIPSPTVPTTPTQTQAPTPPAAGSDFNTKLEALQKQLAGAGADKTATETAYTGAASQELNQINAEIARHNADAVAHQEAALKSGETTGFASRAAQEVQRTDSIAGLYLTARQQLAQGNYSLALKAADSAVETKYAQVQQDIITAKNNIYANYDTFSKEEKKRADALLLSLDSQDAFVKQQQQNGKDINAIAVTAAQNGADSATVAKIQGAKDAAEAQQIATVAGFAGSTGGFTLSAGQTRYDAQGNPLVTAPSTSGGDSLLSVSEAQALGVPYGTTKSQAMGITPTKPATAAQETTALYANRIEQSNAIISKLDKYAANANPLAFGVQGIAPNFLKSADFQSLDQAQRNFVNAALRRESGAAISPSEFDSARKQYFTQPGDSPQVIAQKKANRDLVERGFIQGAGGAYTPIDPYASYRSQLQPGEILVNRDGQAVAVTEAELEPTDIKL